MKTIHKKVLFCYKDLIIFNGSGSIAGRVNNLKEDPLPESRPTVRRVVSCGSLILMRYYNLKMLKICTYFL